MSWSKPWAVVEFMRCGYMYPVSDGRGDKIYCQFDSKDDAEQYASKMNDEEERHLKMDDSYLPVTYEVWSMRDAKELFGF